MTERSSESSNEKSSDFPHSARDNCNSANASVSNPSCKVAGRERQTDQTSDETEQSLTVIDACASDENLAESLAQRFARGDGDAFDEVVRVFSPRVARLAHRLLGWSDDIDDLVQEVFVAALKRQRHFRGDASLWTWLSSITANLCRSRLRRRRTWRRWMGFQRERLEPTPTGMVRDETSQRVRDALAQLKQDDREAIVLFYLEELSVRQIAEVLGKTGNAIEVRLHRARHRLAALLKDLSDG
jgi:RNA polymerase sigma-70 factor (ECF subfamily)